MEQITSENSGGYLDPTDGATPVTAVVNWASTVADAVLAVWDSMGGTGRKYEQDYMLMPRLLKFEALCEQSAGVAWNAQFAVFGLDTDPATLALRTYAGYMAACAHPPVIGPTPIARAALTNVSLDTFEHAHRYYVVVNCAFAAGVAPGVGARLRFRALSR